MLRLVIIFFLLSLSTLAFAQSPGAVDVSTFGAKGDGKTDDTLAIQKAADAATARTLAFQPSGGCYLGSAPPVYFPAGHYKISGEITFGGYANVLSDAGAIIEQTGRCRSFVFSGGYTVVVRGIRFLGGTNQIHYSNANIDTSSIKIENCEFQLSTDFAVYTIGTTDGHLSANLVLADSKFIYPHQVLHNVCDAATVRDCWVSIGKQHFADDSAAFVNLSGVLAFDNMFGVPSFGNSKDYKRVRWVDNYNGDLLVRRTRFGGEDAGIPIVHHFGAPDEKHPFMGQTISIETSFICCGAANNANAAVLTLREGVPQLIRLVGNKYLVDSPFIRVDGVDLDDYFKKYNNADGRFKVVIEANMTHPQHPGMPEQLKRFLLPDK